MKLSTACIAALFLAAVSCERHKFEETKALYEQHGAHDDHADHAGHADHGGHGTESAHEDPEP